MPPPRFCIFLQVVVGKPGAKSSTLENLLKKWFAIGISFMGETAPAFCLGNFVSCPFSILDL